MTPALAVIAKAPAPGRSKTRLCPPCTPGQAADLAAAALKDTLAAVAATPGAGRRVLVLDGELAQWRPEGFEVLPQRGDGLAARLASAFEDIGGPALVIGMDSPQVTPALLTAGLDLLRRGERAVLGPAYDGGYWAIGLLTPDRTVFDGVPMSEPTTARAQRARLRSLGIRAATLPALRDVDTFTDAIAVAGAARGGAFAHALAELVPAEHAA